MRLTDFEVLVRHQLTEIPADFLDGIAEVTVSPRTAPHPDRDGIWTLGECIPLPGDDGDPRHLQSRVVLYHGSFQALARESDGFDWSVEAWETLTHEIRHHVEWKARAPDLEAYDRAAEANFARQDREPFDPGFYRDGVERTDGAWQVEDDVFVERLVSGVPALVRFRWLGGEYEVTVPPGATLPAYLSVSGVAEPPEGELVLVITEKQGLRGLFRRPALYQAEVEARVCS
jgi:predicted Zn-dependent protease with MMP-like domain